MTPVCPVCNFEILPQELRERSNDGVTKHFPGFVCAERIQQAKDEAAQIRRERRAEFERRRNENL